MLVMWKKLGIDKKRMKIEGINNIDFLIYFAFRLNIKIAFKPGACIYSFTYSSANEGSTKGGQRLKLFFFSLGRKIPQTPGYS